MDEPPNQDRQDGVELPATVTRGVVVVEQDPNCASAWVSALSGLGAPVCAISEPSVALRSRRFGVFVLGSMPAGVHALDVVRDLALQPTGIRPRVVIISRDPPRRVDRIFVDAILQRPVRIHELVVHVRRLLAHGVPHHARRDLPRTP